ncbi:MAG: DNA primase [Pseudomonadota bacterium]
MSLPPGFLDELRSRTSIAQVVGRKVSWDVRKSNQSKGDWWSPCPFHQEKTASFHVDDRKGYYYCFGCHAKGDALTFVRETENVGFMEAVEILAREAGMQMPARDPQAQQKSDERTELAEIMELAVQFFRLQLKTNSGASARDYLAGRGLPEEARDHWELGFAPAAWQALWDHLTGKGAPEDKVLAAGLAKPSSTGKRPYDTFRNRIMFPIRDARGRAIAFGGRAMDPDDGAKYLNSPETLLFDKGRSLYNHGPARAAVGKDQPLIVAEGYMDVIALCEAGFTGAVAPLGTAVTEHQLALLWRMTDEPIIALDGDTAGLRAANRVMDLALPLIEAGKSLRFALMPKGQDPDDVLRSGGPEAMNGLIKHALPMVQLLWRRETEGVVLDSPERRAMLDKALREALYLIKDQSLRHHYGQEIARLRAELFQSSVPGRVGALRRGRVGAPQHTTKQSHLAAEHRHPDELRISVVLAALARTPELIAEFEDMLERLDVHTPRQHELRIALLSAAPTEHLLENFLSEDHVRLSRAVRAAGDADMVRVCVEGELVKLFAALGHRQELEEAMQDVSEDAGDPRLLARIRSATDAISRAAQKMPDDGTDFETAENGVQIARSDKNGFEAVLSSIAYQKKQKH